MKTDEVNSLTQTVIGAAIEVHRVLGPGLLESAYEVCLCHELALRQIPFERQRELPFIYKDVHVDCGYRLDILVANMVVVELKAVEALLPIHKAQMLSYFRLGRWPVGLLLNFHVPVLTQGIKRIILDQTE